MKKLFEVKEGDYYYSKCFNSDTKTFDKEFDKSLITKVVVLDNDLIYVAYEEGNSWNLDVKSIGYSISLTSDNLIYFIGTCEESVNKGIKDYFKGEYITI